MTTTDPNSRFPAQREGRPTNGSRRIDAILSVIDRGLEDATLPAPPYRPECEQFCTIGRTSEAQRPATPGLTVVDGANRRSLTSVDAFEVFGPAAPTRKEVA